MMTNNNNPARIVVVGAGLIGERHAKLVARHNMTELAAIVDPAPQSDALAEELHFRKAAEKLFISISTVKTHVSKILMKLDAKRRTQAIQKAREFKLIP